MDNENERLERCFWCGKLKDKSIVEDENTVKNSAIKNYVPCDECRKEFADGIHCIGVTEEPIVQGMFPISKDDETTLYPTGSMFVANEEFIKQLLSDDKDKELLEGVLKERILLLPNEVVETIVDDARKENQGKDVDGYIKEMDGNSNGEEVQD